jgi:hypothetical protein
VLLPLLLPRLLVAWWPVRLLIVLLLAWRRVLITCLLLRCLPVARERWQARCSCSMPPLLLRCVVVVAGCCGLWPVNMMLLLLLRLLPAARAVRLLLVLLLLLVALLRILRSRRPVVMGAVAIACCSSICWL